MVNNNMQEKHSFRAVLFDLDGTLLDTARDLGNALNHVLESYDRPKCVYHQYRNIASDGAKGLLELGFGDDLANIEYEPARQKLLDFYEHNICAETLPFHGVMSCLEKLNEHAIPWGIVTNKPGWLTDKLLIHFPIMAQCASVISGDTLSKRKPDPLPLITAAKQLGVEPKNTLYIGDALRDIEAANAANMISVIAHYGYISENEDINAWNAQFTISSIDKMWEL